MIWWQGFHCRNVVKFDGVSDLSSAISGHGSSNHMSSLTLSLPYWFCSPLLYRHNHATTRPLRKIRESPVQSSSSSLHGRGYREVGEGNQTESDWKGESTWFAVVFKLVVFVTGEWILRVPNPLNRKCFSLFFQTTLQQVSSTYLLKPTPSVWNILTHLFTCPVFQNTWQF